MIEEKTSPHIALKTSQLPPIRTTVEEAKADMEEYGLTRISGVASPAIFKEALDRMIEQCEGEEAAGIALHDSAEFNPGAPAGVYVNQRLRNLINKGQIFRDLLFNPPVLELMRHLLGEDATLFSTTANIAWPGAAAQQIHADGAFVPPDTPYPMIVNSAWMLEDFTEENGATRVVPYSHKFGYWPTKDMIVESLPATGPAGTVMIWEGRTWHGTGANRSDKPRHALLNAYCRPYVRPQENSTVSVSPEVLENASPELLAMLGFKPWFSMGGIEGSVELNPGRPKSFSTELASSGQPKY